MAKAESGATGCPSGQASKLDQLFEEILPAIVKIVKPSVSKFSGNSLEYSKFKAAFKVEVDIREVYDTIEKLKFLLDVVEGSAKSCLAKFIRVLIDMKWPGRRWMSVLTTWMPSCCPLKSA